jgi:hypothetical protein
MRAPLCGERPRAVLLEGKRPRPASSPLGARAPEYELGAVPTRRLTWAADAETSGGWRVTSRGLGRGRGGPGGRVSALRPSHCSRAYVHS